MRHRVPAPMLIVLVVLSLVTVAATSRASAQETTPAAPPSQIELAPGVVVTDVVFAAGQEAPVYYHMHIDTDVVYPFEPSSSISLVYVDTGRLTLQLEQPVTVNRAGLGAATGERIDPNTEFTISAGDYLVLTPNTRGELRNAGPETVTLIVADLHVAEPALVSS